MSRPRFTGKDELAALYVQLAHAFDLTLEMSMSNSFEDLTQAEYDVAMTVNLRLHQACAALEKVRP